MSLRERLDQAQAAWQEAKHPVARRLLPWATSMLAAARESLQCGLDRQTEVLLERVLARLASIGSLESQTKDEANLLTLWDGSGLPAAPTGDRQARVYRKVRSMRAARLPFQGEFHPEAMGLAWGPYNQQSAVAEALKAAARVDPLWVDDFLEREKAMRSLDELLGQK